ncbi:TetR/AcrR family transcriptional regulator [Actinacidiphila guanduensis]|uniref:Transcriptional regulator, TetR family n=1 Tax=Actinacidiphila guanduensis TaxID=310781 RepID=A0A1H0F8J2_9ACTN|nr:TetR family transcriptional regulator [Actinacidiphila guanduensis]SDN90943.1 transcriptional regulator, TetR family [Actinacidiphila guanduensis]
MAQLRESKKRQTRQAITHAATALFMERGFEETTIAEIAEAAGVAKMTVTNYFPRKEDLFFDMHDEVVLGPARAFADRAAGASALDAVRDDCLRAIARHDPLMGRTDPAFTRVIDRSPVLRARLREIFEQREQALSVVIAEAVGADIDAFEPRYAAARLATVLRLLWEQAQIAVRRGADEDDVFALLDRTARSTFAELEPSLGGYAVRAG